MSKFIKDLLAFGAVCAIAVLCLALPVTAAPADKTGAPEASEPKDDGAGDAAKPDEKGDEAPPPDAKAEDADEEVDRLLQLRGRDVGVVEAKCHGRLRWGRA